MEVLHTRVAGLDLHKATVVACVRRIEGGRTMRECRTFETTTAGLLALLDWLTEAGCTHVAMEATGVYWRPVWNLLDGGDFTLLLANAAHVKNVPGRKTDLNDAMWIADLAACGLVKASYVPDRPQHELRSLLRTRKQFQRERTSHVQRMQKTLEEANIKLDSVICEIVGVNGRRILEAMIAGERDPARLAALTDRRLKASRTALQEALHGRLTDHHRFLLRLHLGQYDALGEAIRQIDDEVAAAVERIDAEAPPAQASFPALIALLCTIPGVSRLAALTILAEVGWDMSRFPTDGHLLAWAGLCPGHDESAGKRRSSRLRKGAPWLKTLMVQCAWAAQRKKGSYYQAQFQHLRRQRGPQKAICAVAASLLRAVYHMLKNGIPHQDLGGDHFQRRPPEVRAKRLVTQLNRLGYDVNLKAMPNAA